MALETPMVNKKMIEAAARADAAFAGRTFDALSGADKKRFLERAKLMLEAALSTDADPVGYIHDFRATLQSNWARDFSFSPLAENDYIRNIKPVYAAPPAPSVSVKASPLAHALASELERMGQPRPNGDILHDALSRVLPALSAQVQDVARWQDISTAPIGASGKPETYFIGARKDGERVNVATCYRNSHSAFEWWGGGMNPTHWMPFPAAAPAAKLEEKP